MSKLKDSYADLPPEKGETEHEYISRLDSEGYEETFLRKALDHHFGMALEQMSEFFENYPNARMRHLALLEWLEPNRTDYSFTLKISKNLGVSKDRAAYWLSEYRKWKTAGNS